MKKKIRNIIMLLVILSLALGMTACGAEKAENKPTGTAAPTDEYVYAPEFTTLSENNTRSFNPKIYTDDGFYATSYEKVGENIPEGAVLDYEGQYDVYQSKLYYIGFDGSVQELTEYKSVSVPENTGEKRDYSSETNLSGLSMAPDGNLVAIECVYEQWFDGPEDVKRGDEGYYDGMNYVSNYYIRKLDPSGKELSCARIETEPDTYIYAYSMATDKDGNAIVVNDTTVRVIGPDGKDVAKVDTENYPDSIFLMNDGTPAVTVWGDDREKICTLDIENKCIGKTYDLPLSAYTVVSGGGDYDVYYNDGSYLCGFKLGSEKPDRLFNWINCDINGGEVEKFKINEDGSIILVTNKYNNFKENYTVEMAKVSKVPASSLPVKENISLATLGVDWDVRNLIIDFNRKSDDCRIVIKDYSEYNTDENSNAGLTKLTTELLAGNVPDIIDLSGLPYTQLASKGILADLYPYIDSDEEFSRDDFFQNVFRALEVNGKLCSTCANFSVNALVGASRVVGDKIGWTYEQFYEALAKMPEGCEPLDVSATCYDVLSTCLALDLNQYMDWGSGKCRFDSDDFKQMLVFTSIFPEKFDWENFEWTEESNQDTRIAEGRQMLMQAYISSVSDIRYYDFYFGGDATYVGYPTLSGTGNMLGTGSGFAMSENSTHKDQVWKFLRQFYTEDTQSNVWSLPTNKNVFNKLLQKEMTPDYQKDSDGNYVLDENGEKIEISKGGMGTSTGEVFEFYALTQAQADELLELIESTDKISNGNEKLYDIVAKHAQAFYAGDKSLDETAKFIQSEANIYINEQR